MTSPAFDSEIFFDSFKLKFKENILPLIHSSRNKFKKLLNKYFLFNLSFILLIVFEIGYFFIRLSFFVQTFVVAIYLALIFASIFCYFTLYMYAYTYKAEKIIQLKSEFVLGCRGIVQDVLDTQEHHEFVADACCEFATKMHGGEYTVFKCVSFLSFLQPTFERLSCWYFWHDFHFFKELLLRACVDEHIQMVRMQPTEPEAHARLANSYVMVSGLYVDPRTVEGWDDERWIPLNKYSDEFREKFRVNAAHAIEEFKILNDYAPDDPWVHAQLAYSYHDLQMPLEEIKEYEILISMCPEDFESLYNLGKLYFHQGENAKGLQVYNILKRKDLKRAEALILHYDAYS